MLQMKTDLLKVNRLDKLADAWILANGKTGMWVSFSSTGVQQVQADGDLAVPIFTESNRDGTAGFTGDVGVTGKVTVLFGKMEAITDQFVGTPAVGEKLYAGTDGQLSNAADATGGAITPSFTTFAVAMCTKASTAMEWFGSSINVIEYVTL